MPVLFAQYTNTINGDSQALQGYLEMSFVKKKKAIKKLRKVELKFEYHKVYFKIIGLLDMFPSQPWSGIWESFIRMKNFGTPSP
jgi:hypothetical protein